MLTLSRKLGEEIVIGHNIVLRVVQIERGKIRLGITAPKEIPVYRSEIHERIQKEKTNADNQPTETPAADGPES